MHEQPSSNQAKGWLTQKEKHRRAGKLSTASRHSQPENIPCENRSLRKTSTNMNPQLEGVHCNLPHYHWRHPEYKVELTTRKLTSSLQCYKTHISAMHSCVQNSGAAGRSNITSSRFSSSLIQTPPKFRSNQASHQEQTASHTVLYPCDVING